MEIRTEDVIAVIREAAPFFDDEAKAHQITVKGIADYVTEVDKTVEEFLEKRLKEKYPKIQFMGEERDNSGIDFNGAVWILDPVDGTTNLIHDYHHSAISLGLCENKVMTMGIIYQPYTNEIFYAKRGCGAYLNGKQIHVTKAETLEESLISIGTSPYQKELAERNFRQMQQTFLRCQDIRRGGSAALDLAYVACGRIDAFYEYSLKPWDYAAGLLLVEEAGGAVTDYQGDSIRIGEPSQILASNGTIGTILRDEVLNRF
ncbi:inositol monophosphatase family protein [Clostridium sp. AM58-1XD]|uniref:inositol monophosphatase family protein n=1 Tax=Clostridium sp. AM58-1XD TaxID=2292307 RepID=UPI000E4EB1DA|nr:inositol monophosphatase family protein [Clostridium sp. AM58-1XD]RGZ00988.1 inositol monophosphatase [Clostridium sp. AM58-1XD]